MTDRSNLFEPVRMGSLDLPNRVMMAPLTRNRASEDAVPHELAPLYYRQRASAGLIFTEATQISRMGKGYAGTPGIYNDDQVAAWKEIIAAVHAGGGRIFCQLWHVGRISHTSLLPDGEQPVSASAVRAETQTYGKDGMVDCSEPVALDAAGIRQTLRDYRNAAECAKRAGFDGVEVHSANGYLLDQFLQDGVNRRDDRYGGSVTNRMRLLEEVLDEVTGVWDASRVGVRLSPLGEANDITDSDPEALFSAVYDMLSDRQLAYLHVVEKFPGNEQSDDDAQLIARLRKHYTGFYIANGGYDGDSGAQAVGDGRADAITYGRPFLANPDLPERIRQGAKLNAPNQETFYGGGAEGYVDYPFLDGPAK